MNIVIVGAGAVGSHLAKLLSSEGGEVTVIDNDRRRLDSLVSYADVETIEGEPASIKTLMEADVDKADLFIAAVPYVDQEVNIVSAMFARKLGAKKVVARIKNTELLTQKNRQIIRDMGIDMTFCPEKIAADEIVSQLRHGATAESMDFAQGKLHIEAFRLGEDSPILDMKLVDFVTRFSTDEAAHFRVIAISRDGKTIIPKFDTKFRFGDLVYITIKREGVPVLTRFLGVSDMEVNSVMIMGGSTVGKLTASALTAEIDSVKLVEIDREKCLDLVEDLPNDVMVVNGDGRNADFLFEEGISGFDAFVALTGSDEANILACVAAKKFGVAKTIAEVENIEYVHIAEELGVDTVINKKLVTASRIFKLTLSDRARFVHYMSGTDAEILEYTVAEDSRITKAPLKDIDFPKDVVIGGIIRNNEAIIPVGMTLVKPGDRVAVFALPGSGKVIDRLFS